MRERIVLAEDDPATLDALARMLEREGFEVTPVSDGADLIDVLANRAPFDVVVTDVSMPWMSGLQVARSLRNAGMKTPVVVMTALGDESLAEKARQLGERVSFLRKPFSFDELKATIDALLA